MKARWAPLAGGLGAWLACTLATGCLHYHARPLDAASSLSEFQTRSLDSPELGAFLRERAGVVEWPPHAWDLRSLTPAALFFSPDLDVARARWGVARAGAITAGARPNPSATASAGYNASAAPGVTPWIPELVLDIPIETAGRRGIRVDEARHLSEAARLDVVTTAWKVRSRLQAAYVDLFLAKRTATLLARERDLQTESVRILEAQLSAGEVSANEATRARIALDRARLEAIDADRAVEQASIRLAGALGLPPRALEGVDLSFEDLRQVRVDFPTDEIRHQALLSRADILGGLSAYEASQSALQLEIAKQYPGIDILPGYQLDQTDHKWTLSISLPLPILNRNRGPIAEAEARRTESAAGFLALQSRVIGEVEAALAAARSAAESVAAAEAMTEQLKRRKEIAESAYRIGEISKLDLLGSRLELAAGELSGVQALVMAQSAVGKLEAAVQDPAVITDWVFETPERASREPAADE